MQIKSLLFVLMLFSIIYPASLYVQLDVCKNDSTTFMATVINQTSELPPSSRLGMYKLVLLDNQRKIMYEYKTLLGWPFFESLGKDTVIQDSDCARIEWIPPYSRDISFFQLYKTGGNKLLLEAPLNFCNLNAICESNENKLSCPEDCNSEDIPPSKEPISDPERPDQTNILLLIGALCLVLKVEYL